jgi:hypothetical protein
MRGWLQIRSNADDEEKLFLNDFANCFFLDSSVNLLTTKVEQKSTKVLSASCWIFNILFLLLPPFFLSINFHCQKMDTFIRAMRKWKKYKKKIFPSPSLLLLNNTNNNMEMVKRKKLSWNDDDRVLKTFYSDCLARLHSPTLENARKAISKV